MFTLFFISPVFATNGNEQLVHLHNCARIERYGKPTTAEHAKAQYERGKYFSNDKPTLACQWYKEAAKHGFALYELGSCYFYGNGVPQDVAEGLKWYKKDAQEWDADHLYELGLVYFQGEYVQPDVVQAEEFFLKAAVQGHIKAQNMVHACRGHSCQNHSNNWPADDLLQWQTKAENCKKTCAILQKAAVNQNNPNAQTVWGLVLYDAAKTQDDKKRAWDWIEKGANGGNAYACMTLARRFQYTDHDAYFCWCLKAAQYGDAHAQWLVGSQYAGRFGANYKESSDQGDLYASCYPIEINGVIIHTYKLHVEEDLNQARYWFELSAGQGYSAGMRDLARILNCTDIQLATWKHACGHDVARKNVTGWQISCPPDILNLIDLNQDSFIFFGTIAQEDLEHIHLALAARQQKQHQICSTLKQLYFSQINFKFHDMLHIFKPQAGRGITERLPGLGSQLVEAVNTQIVEIRKANDNKDTDVTMHLKDMLGFELVQLPKILVLPKTCFTLDQKEAITLFFNLLQKKCQVFDPYSKEVYIVAHLRDVQVLWR